MPKNILLVEDDDTLRNAIEVFLKRLGMNVQTFSDVESAIKNVQTEFDLVLSDIMMPGLTGFDLLKFFRKKYPNVPILLMTAFGTIEKAVDAMKHGAYDFLVKPFSLNVLETAVNAAFLDRAPLPHKDGESFVATKMPESNRATFRRVSDQFKTRNPKMLEIIDNLKRIASSKATVLIQGESGTGKELIAKMIHEFSPRSERIFVAINCAAMPDTLLESELFGHEKGAFTGAVGRQIGKFELSNNGTILLDEISEMSLTMQTKLLRVLQECEIYRVGGVKPIPLNLRVIATTNRDLYEYMKQGNFREDLFYRINVIPIVMPPLRERGEDVIVLVEEFLKEFATLHARKPLEVSPAVRAKILANPWNGNVRELRNAIERVVLVGDFEVLDEVFDIPASQPVQAASLPISLPEIDMKLADIERKVILDTLKRCGGNRTKTADKLGISLRTLRNKLKSYGESSAEPVVPGE